MRIKHKRWLAKANAHTKASKQINPKLFSFVLTSVFISTSALSLVTSFTDPQATITKAIYVFPWWAFVGTLCFLLLRLTGKGIDYLDTISLVIQLFSVTTVIAAFISVAGTVAIRFMPIAKPVFSLNNVFTFIDDALMIYYISQATLIAFYLPIALLGIGDSKKKTVNPLISTLLSIATVILAIAIALSSSTAAISICDSSIGSGNSDASSSCGGNGGG